MKATLIDIGKVVGSTSATLAISYFELIAKWAGLLLLLVNLTYVIWKCYVEILKPVITKFKRCKKCQRK